MKSIINLLCMLAFLFSMTCCSGSKKDMEQDSIVDSIDSNLGFNELNTEPEEESEDLGVDKNVLAFTAVEGYGMYGKVKSVKMKDKIVNFNKIGNIESIKNLDNGGGESVYYYESPFKYGFEEGDYNWVIKIENNIRIDGRPDWNEFEEFEFDDKHRLIRHSFLIGMSPVTHYYTYSGNERLPFTLSYEYYDETGTDKMHVKYTYLDVDKHGNWLRRKCEITGTSTYYEGESNDTIKTKDIDPYEEIETRKIIYF